MALLSRLRLQSQRSIRKMLILPTGHCHQYHPPPVAERGLLHQKFVLACQTESLTCTLPASNLRKSVVPADSTIVLPVPQQRPTLQPTVGSTQNHSRIKNTVRHRHHYRIAQQVWTTTTTLAPPPQRPVHWLAFLQASFVPTRILPHPPCPRQATMQTRLLQT